MDWRKLVREMFSRCYNLFVIRGDFQFSGCISWGGSESVCVCVCVCGGGGLKINNLMSPHTHFLTHFLIAVSEGRPGQYTAYRNQCLYCIAEL